MYVKILLISLTMLQNKWHIELFVICHQIVLFLLRESKVRVFSHFKLKSANSKWFKPFGVSIKRLNVINLGNIASILVNNELLYS